MLAVYFFLLIQTVKITGKLLQLLLFRSMFVCVTLKNEKTFQLLRTNLKIKMLISLFLLANEPCLGIRNGIILCNRKSQMKILKFIWFWESFFGFHQVSFHDPGISDYKTSQNVVVIKNRWQQGKTTKTTETEAGRISDKAQSHVK